MMASSQSLLDDPAADVALALAGVSGEEGAAVVDLGDAAAQRGVLLHFAQHIGKKHHLAVTGAGDETKLRVAVMLDDETRVQHAPLATHALQVGLPALAVWGVRKHEVELAAGEGVCGESGAKLHVVGFDALSLQYEVGLADGVGLWVYILAVQMDGDLLALLTGQLRQRLLCNGQHPASAAGAVVDQVGSGLDLLGNRQEDEAGHELHHVARGEVLPGFLIILLVEAPE